MGPSDVPAITEDWYRECGIVDCRMRDEPLERDQQSFNVTSAASAVHESQYVCPATSGHNLPVIYLGWLCHHPRRATPSLGRLQRNLTRSGHLHEPRSTTVRFALLVPLWPSLLDTRQLPRVMLDHADCDQGDRDESLDQRWWGLLVCSRLARAHNDAFCHGWIIPCLSSLSHVHSICSSPRALRTLEYTNQSQSSR